MSLFTKKYDTKSILIIIGLTAFISRVIVALLSNNVMDISWYLGWARGLQEGLTTGYLSMSDLDYPPLFLPILYIIARIDSLLQLTDGRTMFLIRCVTIVVDVLTCLLIYRVVIMKCSSEKYAFIAAILYALNPAVLLNTSWWGQTDGQIMFFVVLVCWLIENKHYKWGAVVTALAVLTKIQGLFILPIFGLELLRTKNLKTIALSSLAFLAVFVAGLAPYARHTNLFNMIERIYFNAAGMRPIASLWAFNFHALLGGANRPDHYTPVGSLSFFIIGITLTALIFTVFTIYYLTRKRTNIWLGMTFVFYTIFMFMPRMHERYMIYIIPLILITAFTIHIETETKWVQIVLKSLFGITTVVIFINHAILMWGVQNQLTREYWINNFEHFVRICSVFSFITYVIFFIIYYCVSKPYRVSYNCDN